MLHKIGMIRWVNHFYDYSDSNERLSVSNPADGPFDPESRGILQGTPPKYTAALFHFIETFETIQKTPKDMNPVVRHGGEICTQTDTQILEAYAPLPHCPRETALKQISLNEKGSPFPPQ